MLFDSFSLKNEIIKNRVVMPPMVTFKFSTKDGYVTDKHISYYKKRAKSEVGTIIVEATCVSENQRVWNQLNIFNDKFIPKLSCLSKAINDEGCLSVIQLHNAGIKASEENDKSYGPSASEEFSGSREMTLGKIKNLKNDFVNAAIRAKQAGFKGVEIHGAHGYILSEFTSKYYNKRKDEYGGCVQNRFKLSKEIISEIRNTLGDDYLIYYRYGVNHEDINDFKIGAKILEDAGVDILDVSYTFGTGGNSDNLTGFEFNEITKNAKQIKESVNIPVIAVNNISTPKRAEFLLKNKYCDFTAIGRELLSDYKWAYKAKNDLNINYCYHCKPKCHLNKGDMKCPNLIKAGDTLE